MPASFDRVEKLGTVAVGIYGLPTGNKDALMKGIVAKLAQALASDATLTAALTAASVTIDDVSFVTTPVFSEQEALRAVPITPNDSTDLPRMVQSIYCAGTSGSVAYLDGAGNAKTASVSSGGYVSDVIGRVKATGTTATGLVGISRRANVPLS